MATVTIGSDIIRAQTILNYDLSTRTISEDFI
jgi:hypothetical protein